jgi:hypothetical protein
MAHGVRFGVDNVYVIFSVAWLGITSTWMPVAATNTGRGLNGLDVAAATKRNDYGTHTRFPRYDP